MFRSNDNLWCSILLERLRYKFAPHCSNIYLCRFWIEWRVKIRDIDKYFDSYSEQVTVSDVSRYTEAPGNCRGRGNTLCFSNGLRPMSLTLGLIIDTCLIHCLHWVFPSVQNSKQRIKPIRILNIPPASYPKRRRHPRTLNKIIPSATRGSRKNHDLYKE